jgi:2-methylisocitrate lyase-like PEP mutase family enzyme
MVQKIRAAKDAAHDPDLVVIARTDALAVEGFEAAIGRALAYREAGADVLFVEAPESEAQIAEIASRLPYPNWSKCSRAARRRWSGGPPARTRLCHRHHPSDLQRAAIFAMRETLAVIRRDGNSGAIRDRLLSFKDREGGSAPPTIWRATASTPAEPLRRPQDDVRGFSDIPDRIFLPPTRGVI